MFITIIGSGDAFGSGGRFNTCLQVDAGEERLLLDCGASSLVAMNKAGIDRNRLSGVLVTHFHADHFGGLPIFLLDAQFRSHRTQPLLIAGPKGVEGWCWRVMDALFPGDRALPWRFPITFLEVSPDTSVTIAGMAVTAFPMLHDARVGPCQGYRLEAGGKVFAFSGDTTWTDALVALSAGADAMLIECYSRSTKLKNHLDYDTIAANRASLTARRLILTHMGPGMVDLDEPLPEERAHDGMVIAL